MIHSHERRRRLRVVYPVGGSVLPFEGNKQGTRFIPNEGLRAAASSERRHDNALQLHPFYRSREILLLSPTKLSQKLKHDSSLKFCCIIVRKKKKKDSHNSFKHNVGLVAL